MLKLLCRKSSSLSGALNGLAGQFAPAACVSARNLSTPTAGEELKERLSVILKNASDEVKELRKAHGHIPLGEYTIDQAFGGARGIKCLVTETSLLDPDEGIRYRNHTLPELQKVLPRANDGIQPLPEGAFWLLLTGEIPTQQQVENLSKELASRAELPGHVVEMLNNFPSTLHPMAQFISAVAAMHSESKFSKAYAEGVHKSKYWEYTLEDTLDCVARVPVVAAMIYRNVFKDKKIGKIDSDLDLGANFAHLLGNEDPQFVELLRLYLVIHADHEGGNVSAHATHLVGSALSDSYLSLAAGLCGLAGPLHGLANQEVLVWLTRFKERLGNDWESELNEKAISKAVWETLESGQVVPGFGHAVLRRTDPRYTCQREFALKHLRDAPDFRLVSLLYKVVPDILMEQGKAKNPWPNVDAHSGILLAHYGLTEMNFYTVLFGVSRAMGVLSSLVWDRALGLPIERPKSMTIQALKKEVKKIRGAV